MSLDELKKRIEKSNNRKIAEENFNFLISNENLTSDTISQILAITEGINSGSQMTSKHYKRHYRFDGGILTKENLEKILEIKEKDTMLVMKTMAEMI